MIMAKDKTIKTATLKKRFEKLHHAANYAEECAKAIVFHADRLSMDGQSASQTEAFQRMANAIGTWTGKFARMGTEIQKVESMYLDHLTNDNTECKLIEQVPLIGKYGYVTPDAVQIEAKFFEIGYYELEGDPYSVSTHVFSRNEVVADIKYLNTNIIFFLKALANAEFHGIWSEVGNMAGDIYNTVPNTQIADFLAAYGVDYRSDDKE